MATVSFRQNVTIKDKKVIKQIAKDLRTPTFDLSKLDESQTTPLPKVANDIWFKNSAK